MSSVDRRVAGLDGSSALPRKNGELVFAAPWEGRAFGMAVVLDEKGAYPWDEFRSSLVSEIATDADRAYYESWLAALEKVAVARGLVTPQELERRAAEYRELARDPVF